MTTSRSGVARIRSWPRRSRDPRAPAPDSPIHRSRGASPWSSGAGSIGASLQVRASDDRRRSGGRLPDPRVTMPSGDNCGSVSSSATGTSKATLLEFAAVGGTPQDRPTLEVRAGRDDPVLVAGEPRRIRLVGAGDVRQALPALTVGRAEEHRVRPFRRRFLDRHAEPDEPSRSGGHVEHLDAGEHVFRGDSRPRPAVRARTMPARPGKSHLPDSRRPRSPPDRR